MPDGRLFAVESVAAGAAALDYFNGFHDGFIKRIVVTSHDEFEPDGSQVCTGQFDVAIDFAHYNYAAGTRPPTQMVSAEFDEAQDLYCDLREALYSAPILDLRIEPAERLRANSTARESCLALAVTRPRYLAAERRWDRRESQLFTFARARFREAPAE
jgi:hypothetical protein